MGNPEIPAIVGWARQVKMGNPEIQDIGSWARQVSGLGKSRPYRVVAAGLGKSLGGQVWAISNGQS